MASAAASSRGAALCAALSCALVLLPASTSYAAESGGAGWVGVTLRVPFAQRYSFQLQTEPRFFERPERLRVLLLRPWFEMAFPHGLAIGLGYDGLLFLFPTGRQEHRLWQQVSHGHDFDSIRTFLRARLEQRFFSDIDDVSIRGRFFIGVEVPIVREVAFLLNDELFVSFNEIAGFDPRGLSENRLFGGFGWGPREWAAASLGYQNQWLRIFNLVNHTLFLQLIFTVRG